MCCSSIYIYISSDGYVYTLYDILYIIYYILLDILIYKNWILYYTILYDIKLYNIESKGFPSGSILSLGAMGWGSGGEMRVRSAAAASAASASASAAELGWP